MPASGPGQQFGQTVQQNQQNQFNAIANVPLQGQVTGMQQQQQSQGGDKFSPGNIFAAMKKSEFGKPDEQRPQDSGEPRSEPNHNLPNVVLSSEISPSPSSNRRRDITSLYKPK